MLKKPFLVSECAAEPVYLTDSRYQRLLLFPEKLCFSPLKAFIVSFFFVGTISVLNIATVIIEVLVAQIMDCLTATRRRMSRVSD